MRTTDRGQQFGAYILTEHIGVGGMAEVFAARLATASDTAAAPYALKRMRQELLTQPVAQKAFEVEQQIAASLRHSHIVPVHDVGTASGVPYIVMQRMPAGALTRLVTHEPWPLDHVCLLLADVASALDAAHTWKTAAGALAPVVHRDVSPSNILMHESGELLLSDFGIAHIWGTAMTTTGQRAPKGKYAYMSPEQVKNVPLSTASDVFSLATLAIECATGKHPFRGKNDWQTMQAIAQPKLPALPELTLVPWLQTLLRAMAAEEPHQRPSAAQVCELLAAQPIAKRTPGLRQSFARRMQLNTHTQPQSLEQTR
jgi:serine/threonine protein kinase